MGWSAAAAVGGALISADASSKAADSTSAAAQSAADTSADASKYSADIQKQIYDQTRADQAPWRTAGANALAQMVAGMGTNGTNGELTRSFGLSDFQQDPGYQFRLAEGEKALQRTAAAGGRLYSGRFQKDAMRFNSGLASDEYGNSFNRFQSNQTNKFNRLASLAGVGQTANNALQQAGQGYASSVGNLAMTNAANQGNSALVAGLGNASAYNGTANAIGRAIGQIDWSKVGSSSSGNNAGAYDASAWNTWG